LLLEENQFTALSPRGGRKEGERWGQKPGRKSWAAVFAEEVAGEEDPDDLLGHRWRCGRGWEEQDL
jgi:hypothetical protein